MQLLPPLFALVLAANAPGEVIKPAVEGPEGLRAFNDLGTYYQNGKKAPPIQEALKDLTSASKEKQGRAGRYLRALLEQSFADEKNGRAEWKRLPYWGGGSENPARQYRNNLAQTFASKAVGTGALSAIEWLLEKEMRAENQAHGIEALRRIHGEEANGILLRILKKNHPHAGVTFGAIEEIGIRKLLAAAAPLKPFCLHYRKKIREAAVKSYQALGAGAPPAYVPEHAFTPYLESMLKEIGAMVLTKIPKEASWKRFNVTLPAEQKGEKSQTYAFDGWLLGKSDKTLHVLGWFAEEHRIPDKHAKVEARTWQQTASALSALRSKGNDPKAEGRMENLSRRGGLTGQFEARSVSLPEALISAWAYARGDKKSAAAVLFPRIEATADDRWVKWIARDLLGHKYHQEMLTSFSYTRDYKSVLVFARHLSKPLFNEYQYQDRAKELVKQLTVRGDDFKTFTLPTPADWNNKKKNLSRENQITYLAKRLRLLNCFQWGQPGGVNYEDEQFSISRADLSQIPKTVKKPKDQIVINPYKELLAMKLAVADLTFLAPYLADENFMLTFSYWRDFHPSRTLHRVQWVVGHLLNEAAKRDLAQLKRYGELDAAGKKKHIEAILDWCEKNAGTSRIDLILDSMRTAKDWRTFSKAAGEAMQGKVKVKVKVEEAFSLLIKRMQDFPEQQDEIAELGFVADQKDSSAQARKWLLHTKKGVRFWAALMLLRHGDTAKLEGLESLREVLTKDDGSHWYPRAIETLANTGKEPALKLACGILAKKEFRPSDWNAGPILHRLLLLGRTEALEFALKGLDSNQKQGTSSGTWNDKDVQREQFEFDAMAELVIGLRKDEMRYESLAPKEARLKKCAELKVWLKKQFDLIRSGQPHGLKVKAPRLRFSRWQLDAP